MTSKNKFLVLLTSFIIIIQIIIYVNNNQKSSFRYFIWNIKEIEIGKLISISFLSGFIISSVLNKNYNFGNKIDHLRKNEIGSEEENQNIDKNEGEDFTFEIPPQRDVRETQPTISVNYRVIKNANGNEYGKKENKYNEDIQEDWSNSDEDNNW